MTATTTTETYEAQRGLHRVARSSEVGEQPLSVQVLGQPFVLVRTDGVLRAFRDRCPHRLAPLSAGGVVEGRLQCGYHGWRFDGSGTCVDVPATGRTDRLSRRMRLTAAAALEERDGEVWLDPGHDEPTAGEVLTNVDPALRHGWHPVARVQDLSAGPLAVRLLGETWTVDGAVNVVNAAVDVASLRATGQDGASPAAVAVHLGLVWIPPAEPAAGLLACAEVEDPAFSSGWLRPQRCSTPAGLLADNFLDLAHFPFVHAATFGAADEVLVPAYEVQPDDTGFSMRYEHLYRNVEDPGVATGERPLLQRRRTSYRYTVPFQLQLRLDHLDSGGRTVILFLLQPEDVGSTAIWCRVLRDDLAGTSIEEAVAFEQAVLDEDLALSGQFRLGGLPLDPTVEVHTRADTSGLALRTALRRLRAAA